MCTHMYMSSICARGESAGREEAGHRERIYCQELKTLQSIKVDVMFLRRP